MKRIILVTHYLSLLLSSKEFLMSRFLNKLFGGSGVRKAARTRPTVWLELDRLDERMLPSTTSSVSQVIDLHGQG